MKQFSFILLLLSGGFYFLSCNGHTGTKLTREDSLAICKAIQPSAQDTVPFVNVFDSNSVKKFNSLSAAEKEKFILKIFDVDHLMMPPVARPEGPLVAEIREFDTHQPTDETRSVWMDVKNIFDLVTTAQTAGASGFRFYLAKDDVTNKLTVIMVATKADGSDLYDPTGQNVLSGQNKGDLCPPCTANNPLNGNTLLSKARVTLKSRSKP